MRQNCPIEKVYQLILLKQVEKKKEKCEPISPVFPEAEQIREKERIDIWFQKVNLLKQFRNIY